MSKIAPLFFFTKPIKHIIFEPFWWAIGVVLVLMVPFLRPWWWLFAPLFLVAELKTLYLWWLNWDYAYAKKKWVVLEIVPPREILAPLKSMEDIFTVLWGPLYSPPSWREKWCEGILPTNAEWLSFEIASIEGNLHFYARMITDHRAAVETALYNHYPELEIREVRDYTKELPQNVPNEEWDTYGEDFILGNKAAYPIRTYEKFFEPQGERIAAEEKRIDPVNSLLELMSRLGPGEHFWLQFIISSIGEGDDPWKDEAKQIITRAARRPSNSAKSLLDDLYETFYNLIMGPKKMAEDKYVWLEAAKSELGENELLLTPGEREVVSEVENKLKKPVFRTTMRGVYVARRENWKPAHKVLARLYFTHFQTQNLNYIRFSTATRPKTQYIFRKRIPFLRSRRMFRNFVLRFPPLFPNRTGETAILNTEELATVFHFPRQITGLVMPTMARVESKKAGPPPNLPTE